MEGIDAWVRYLFDRPGEHEDIVHDSPIATAERLRHLFSNAGTLLSPYTDDQVARGLIEVVDGGPIHVFGDRQIPTVLRTGGLRSIVTLFSEVFAPRIEVEDPQHKPLLQYLCFMFFDIAAIDLGDDTVLDVLKETLALASIPCQRAALHGLGHAYMSSPQHIPAIVDRWLDRNPQAPQELRDYALAARSGDVM